MPDELKDDALYLIPRSGKSVDAGFTLADVRRLLKYAEESAKWFEHTGLYAPPMHSQGVNALAPFASLLKEKNDG